MNYLVHVFILSFNLILLVGPVLSWPAPDNSLTSVTTEGLNGNISNSSVYATIDSKINATDNQHSSNLYLSGNDSIMIFRGGIFMVRLHTHHLAEMLSFAHAYTFWVRIIVSLRLPFHISAYL